MATPWHRPLRLKPLDGDTRPPPPCRWPPVTETTPNFPSSAATCAQQTTTASTPATPRCANHRDPVPPRHPKSVTGGRGGATTVAGGTDRGGATPGRKRRSLCKVNCSRRERPGDASSISPRPHARSRYPAPAISAPRAHWDNRDQGGPGAHRAEPKCPWPLGAARGALAASPSISQLAEMLSFRGMVSAKPWPRALSAHQNQKMQPPRRAAPALVG